jgi:hypothetical protein
MNMYEIYGNLFFHNHREALLQASGRVTIHDNLFVDGPYSSPAVILRTQNYPLKIAYFYNNTIYTTGRGVQLGTRALVDDAIVGNLIFALTPISGSPMMVANNVVDSMTNASMYVKAPSFELGSMDFHPLARKCQGPAIDLTPFQSDMHYTLDFNGTPKGQLKGAVVFRGAYATEGDNPGWLLQVAIKPVLPEAGSSAVSLVWVNPAAAPSGSTKQITLTGANFGEGATVELNGADVKVSNVKVASATEITATLTVAANATAGIRDVTVRTASGVSHPIKLRVQAARRGKL